jgi:hypothetical protein
VSTAQYLSPHQCSSHKNKGDLTYVAVATKSSNVFGRAAICMVAGNASTAVIKAMSFDWPEHTFEVSIASGTTMRAIAKTVALSREIMNSFRADVSVVLRSLSLLTCASDENCTYGVISVGRLNI